MAKASTTRKARYHSKREAHAIDSWKGALLILKLIARTEEHEEITVIANDHAVSALSRLYRNF